MEKTSKKILNVLKKVVIKIIALLISKLLPIILIVSIFFILISAFNWFLDWLDGSEDDKPDNVGHSVSNQIIANANSSAIKKDGDTYSYNLDLDEQTKKIIEDLKANGNETLDKYIPENKQEEYIKSFILAETKSTYLKLNQNSSGLDGLVELQKDGSTITYIDNTTFDQYIKENNNEVLKYFTTDPEGNLILAGYTENTNSENQTIRTYNQVTINYKEQVYPFAMAFNFLWATTVVGEDPDFAYALSQTIDSNSIILSIENSAGLEDTLENQTTYIPSVRVTKANTFLANYTYNSEKENYDINLKTSITEENSFVKIFHNYKTARKNILSTTSWLTGILDENSKTKAMSKVLAEVLEQDDKI